MDKEQTNQRQDRRVARTRGAIVDSFNHLVRERPYESIQVPDILDEAGVGRSTFYEHFRNKDALLVRSASVIFDALANAVNADCDRDSLVAVAAHFGENRQMARDILSGDAFDTIANDLASRVREKLRKRRTDPKALGAAIDLGSRQIAYAQAALVREWLHALEPCNPEQLASLLHRTSVALADAIVGAD